jgi:hypothetical protein
MGAQSGSGCLELVGVGVEVGVLAAASLGKGKSVVSVVLAVLAVLAGRTSDGIAGQPGLLRLISVGLPLKLAPTPALLGLGLAAKPFTSTLQWCTDDSPINSLFNGTSFSLLGGVACTCRL